MWTRSGGEHSAGVELTVVFGDLKVLYEPLKFRDPVSAHPHGAAPFPLRSCSQAEGAWWDVLHGQLRGWDEFLVS